MSDAPTPEVPTEKPVVKLLTTDLPESDGLSERQRAFKDEYLKCWNATEAARRVGLKQPGLAGWRMMKNDAIREAINLELDAHALGAKHVLNGLAEMAHVNLTDFLDERGVPDLERIKKKGHLVKRYKCRLNRKLSTGEIEVTDIELELCDQQAALVDAGRHFKMFGEDATLALIDLLKTVLVRVIDAELPPELGGRVLRRVGEDLQRLRN